MGNLSAYTTSTFSGSFDRGNINVAISSSIVSGSTGNIRFGDTPNPPSGGMVIISDSNTQLGIASASATPQFWIINNLNDTASVLNTINALPERINQTRFVTTSSAYLYLVSSSKYFPILGTEPLNTPVTNGLIMYLDANQLVSYPTTASTWYDMSGNNNSGSLINGPTFNSNGAIVFDGVDDYTNTALMVPSPSTTPTTFNVVFSAPSNQSYKAIMGRSQWQAYGFSVGFIGGSGVITCSTSSIGYEPYFTYNSTLVSMGTFVFNGRSILIYKNGQLVTTLTVPFDIVVSPFPVLIANNGQGGWSYLNCTVYSAQAYNRALTQTEILQNYYQSSIVTSGLVFAADASNAVSYISGSTITYSLTGSASGSLINGVGYNNTNGGAWVMDGADDFMRVSQLTGSNFPQATGTISFWYYVSSVGGNTDFSDKAIFDGYDTSGRNHFFIRNYYEAPNNIQVVGQLSGSGGAYVFAYNAFLPNDQWHNVVLTYTTGSNSSYQIYMDGVFKNSGTLGANPSTFAPNGQYCGFGSGYLGGGAYAAMQGRYSSLLIYNKALTAAEVSQNFNAQRQRFGI